MVSSFTRVGISAAAGSSVLLDLRLQNTSPVGTSLFLKYFFPIARTIKGFFIFRNTDNMIDDYLIG